MTNMKLTKIESFSELKGNELYAILNVPDIKDAINNKGIISFLTYRVIQKDDKEAVLRVYNSDSESTSTINEIKITECSLKALNIHKVDFNVNPVTDNTNVKLNRENKKLKKQNRALRAILKKNGIATTEETQQLREFINKKRAKDKRANMRLKVVDSLSDIMFGQKVKISVSTNYKDTVEVWISVDKFNNLYGMNAPKRFSVKGIATVHPEDEFCYNTGVDLAFTRAKLKFIEELVK